MPETPAEVHEAARPRIIALQGKQDKQGKHAAQALPACASAIGRPDVFVFLGPGMTLIRGLALTYLST